MNLEDFTIETVANKAYNIIADATKREVGCGYVRGKHRDMTDEQYLCGLNNEHMVGKMCPKCFWHTKIYEA